MRGFITRTLPISVLTVLILISVTAAMAQVYPSVDVSLNASRAQINELIYADVMVRNGVNIAGADVELAVEGNCLRVEGMEPGSYMPTSGDRGFTVFKANTETTARLAANVLGRENVLQGDGVFFRVPLRVVCNDNDSTTVRIAQAQLVDDQLTEFKLVDGLLNTTNAVLTVGAESLPVVADVAEQVTAESSSPAKMVIGVLAGLLGIVFLVGGMTFWRRSRQ